MERDPPKRIPAINGSEQDVFTRRARRFYRYTQRPGVCAHIKRGYQRRLRRITRLVLRQTTLTE